MSAVSAQQWDQSPFHRGEQAVQELAGVRALSEQLGRAWHRMRLNKPSQDFFADQQLLYVASRDNSGRLWASALAGPKGFLISPDLGTLQIRPLHRFPGDPAVLEPGSQVGTTAIILATRERMRLNGTVSACNDGCLSIAVQQTFGSCPKYIQARTIEVDVERLSSDKQAADVATGCAQLGEDQQEIIRRADTFFLASCYEGPVDAGEGVRGCDISHRGGLPGFVEVAAPNMLRWADYVGNMTFTTLGNLHADPRAAIFVLDYASGDTLQLSGTARILWDDHTLPGAERTIEFEVEGWVHVRGAIPMRPPGPVTYSPFNPRPDDRYTDAAAEDRKMQLQHNYVEANDASHMLRCLDVVRESADVVTFELELPGGFSTHDIEGALDFCRPGQYATFEFEAAAIRQGAGGDASSGGARKKLTRAWTVSSPTEQMLHRGSLTISVKKVGLVSGWLHQNLVPGRVVCFRGIDGNFTPEAVGHPPPAGVLLVAGGIGVTPMRVMFAHYVARGVPVALVYSVRSEADAVFLPEFAQAALASRDGSVKVVLAVTKPQSQAPGSTDGVTRVVGRITPRAILQAAPNVQQRLAFQCGPIPMMEAMAAMLEEMGFPLEMLHKEDFFF